ncbi:hypothetical protein SAMN05216566_12834 [Aureimonas phyllosphaerae]|uniref:Uncharacterized protein n=1 Tax=Aureimonas phyllosphaerae TaxID=1166078 RepID=A0A7W6FXG2_9HYPH|nr:hypothetical protein [Aureimonas phyllosphaerae]MBB3962094.1 hypothetical protein [Aureimonas phyllosphaerae]SFF56034.1 hypothetical protein SAMN05216566_12834 [Aureimonas phyllosphaerae]
MRPFPFTLIQRTCLMLDGKLHSVHGDDRDPRGGLPSVAFRSRGGAGGGNVAYEPKEKRTRS